MRRWREGTFQKWGAGKFGVHHHRLPLGGKLSPKVTDEGAGLGRSAVRRHLIRPCGAPVFYGSPSAFIPLALKCATGTFLSRAHPQGVIPHCVWKWPKAKRAGRLTKVCRRAGACSRRARLAECRGFRGRCIFCRFVILSAAKDPKAPASTIAERRVGHLCCKILRHCVPQNDRMQQSPPHPKK